MRIFLTVLAIVIVVALTAASVVPLFVDWSAQRDVLAAELTRRVGANVEISGPINLRLLPTPYVTVGRVRIGAKGAQKVIAKGADFWLDCDSMRFELALGSLFAGHVRLNEATLEHPVIHIAAVAAEAIGSRRDSVAARARQFEFDQIVVNHGSLTIDRASGDPILLQDIALDASATSLLGPFRGSGSFSTPDGQRAHFQFAAAEAAQHKLPIKAEIDRGRGGAHAEFDGLIAWTTAQALEPSYQGRVTVSGELPEASPNAGAWPWQAKSALHVDRQGADFNDLTLQAGPDARVVQATGAATLAFGDTLAISATLASKQVNLDSLLRREHEDSAPPSRFFSALGVLTDAALRSGAAPAAQLSVVFSTPQIFLGARTLDNVSFAFTGHPGAPIEGELRAGLPGESHVHLKGAIDLGAAPVFHGEADGEVGEFSVLRQWASLDQLDLAEKLGSLEQALPSGLAKGSGQVEISPVGISVRGLELAIDRSHFAGAMAFTRATANQRGRLFLDLSSDGLDIEVAPNVEAAATWLGDIDLSLSLVASKLRVARLGRSSVDGGSLSLKATKDGARLSLDELSMQDFGGATIEAQGQSSPAGRWARLKVDAAQLHDFASLVSKVAPGRFSDLLLARADRLSPAKATFEARRDGPPLDGDFPLDFIRTDGEAAASRFSVRLSRAPAPVDAVVADITLDAADGGALLRQFGAKIPARTAGRAHVALNASGLWESGFDAAASASLAGADFNWRGRISPAASPGDPLASGAATLKAANLLDAFAAFDLGAAEAAAPVDLSADMVAREGEVEFSKLSGVVAGSKLSGHMLWKAPSADPASDPDVALARLLTGEAEPAAPALTGELALDKATVGALLALSLGPTAPARNGAPWSDAKFSAPLLSPPPTDLRLTIGSLQGIDGPPAGNVSARLRMDALGFDFNEIAGDVAGGKATGRLNLRRDGALAAVTGQLSVDAVALERAALRARLSGRLEFAGTGNSPSALVAGLAGQGEIRYNVLAFPRLDPGALSRVVAKAASPDALIDETNLSHALSVELDRRPLLAPDGSASVALSSGTLRIGPIDLPTDSGGLSLSADYDLRNLTLDLRDVMRETQVGKFWAGPPPSVSVLLHGTLDAPVRKIDVSSLAAGLAAEEIARESERIANFESDMRERAGFNRRLKAWRFLDRRDAEIAAYEAEQQRLADEGERKRVTGEYLRAYQDYVRSRESGLDDLVNDFPLPPPLPAPEPSHLVHGAGARAAPATVPDPTRTGLY